MHDGFTMRAIAAILMLLAAMCVACATAAVGPASLATNMRVSRDRYAAHAEPWLVANPRNPLNLLGAAQLLDGSRATAVLGTFASFDGGHSWHNNGALSLPVGFTHGDDVTTTFTR